jgi:hypothetical protein
MSPLKTSVIVAALSALATAGGLFKLQQGRGHEVSRLKAMNNQMRVEAYRRNQARIVAAAPRVTAAATAPADVTLTTPKLVRSAVEYYRNEGNATPLSALQTFAWACDRGDTEAVGRLLFIDPIARPKVEAFIAALPEGIRVQWKTVDDAVAALLTKQMMAQPFPNAEILETATVEQISADRVKLRMPNVPKDGTEYQQTAEGWKYVLTEKMVDAYIRQSRSPARP